MIKCPNCGEEMEEVADWPDDWLVCLECLTVQKPKAHENRGKEKAKAKAGGR